MALWGNVDAKGAGGTVTLSLVGEEYIVTGTGTTFGQVGAASTGDVIRFGNRSGVYYGDAVVVGIASATQLTIDSVSGLSTSSIGSTSFSISQLPKFTTLDSHYKAGVSTSYDGFVYGVSEDEAQVQSETSYDLSHAGWVGVTTYIDAHGTLRVKSEVMVAMSTIEGDASDDAVLPGAKITILTQPSSVTGVGSTQTATFAVTATVIPSSTNLTYRWQSSPTGVSYTNITNGGVYSGATTNTLSIANTNTSLNGYFYRVNITGSDVTATSIGASMTFA